MLYRTALLVSTASLAACSSEAHAHHSSAPFYDLSRVAEIEGRVQTVKWGNPHVMIEVGVSTERGLEETWKIEGDSFNALQRKGVDVGALKVGERVRVLGAMSRHGRPEMFAAVVQLADGGHLVFNDGLAVRFGMIEQELSTGERIIAADNAPTIAEVRNNLFRVWSRGARVGYPRALEPDQLTPSALAAQAAWNPLTDDPALRCTPQGMPGVMLNPYPVEFVDNGEEIVLRIEEWDAVRRIHIRQDAVLDVAPAPLGHSVGRWEESTLIVRTTHISWPYFDSSGTPQSEAMEVEERFTLVENGIRLEYVQTSSDPSTFTKPAIRTGHFWLEAGAEIRPFNCEISD